MVPSDDEHDEEYEVERIVATRTRKGKVEYQVKWLGYPESENTWQSVDSMNCPDLIAKYEEQKEKTKLEKFRVPSSKSSSPTKSAPAKGRTTEFGKRISLKPQKAATSNSLEKKERQKWVPGDWEELVDRVDTVSRVNGKLHVWIVWNDGAVTEELADETNIRCPQKVIKFYESRLRFPDEKK